MITRRKFMKLLTGGLVGMVFVSKSLVGKVKIKQGIIDEEEDIRLIKASEIISDGLTASDIKVETINRTEHNIVDDVGKWHHFVYHRVGNVEKVYIDGEVDEIMTVFDISSSLENCEIKNYHRNQVGVIVEEEFWFRRKV